MDEQYRAKHENQMNMYIVEFGKKFRPKGSMGYEFDCLLQQLTRMIYEEAQRPFVKELDAYKTAMLLQPTLPIAKLSPGIATFNGMRAPAGWYIASVVNQVEEWRSPAERWLVRLNRNSDIMTVSGAGATDQAAFIAATKAASEAGLSAPPSTGMGVRNS